jgi:hypothetical protein
MKARRASGQDGAHRRLDTAAEALDVELTHVSTLENQRGRFSRAFGIGAAAFSEGMVCAVPRS